MRPRNRTELLAHIEAHPVEGSLASKRRAFAARLAAPEGLGEAHTFAGNRGLLFRAGEPDTSTQAAPIRTVFLHGGGYVLGSPRTHAVLAQTLADALGEPVFSASYPAAPEHPWPAQRDAVLGLLDAAPEPLALVGGSAGGHLALVCALARPGKVSVLALFSPNTDRMGRSDTRAANTPLDAMNSDAGDRAFWELAAPDVADGDPEASPLLADLSQLPPTLLSATEGEVLLGDTLLLARALQEAGVEHAVRVAPYATAGMHMFESWPDALPEGQRAVEAAAEWVAEWVAGHL